MTPPAPPATALDRPSLADRIVPTATALAVLAALAGLAYWGHRSEWRFRATTIEDRDGVVTPPAAATTRITSDTAGTRVAIRYASDGEVEQAGIDVAASWLGPVTEAVEAPGAVAFDPTRLTRPASRAAGVVKAMFKGVGDRVSEGEVLALIDAAEVGRVKAELQQALAAWRLKLRVRADLAAGTGVVSDQRIREADAAVTETEVRVHTAEQVLANLGLSVRADDLKDRTAEETALALRLIGVPNNKSLPPEVAGSANLLPVRAPAAGIVLRCDAVPGEVVEPSKPMFMVADASRMWVTLHLPAERAGTVRVGQPVRFKPDGLSDEFAGVVTRIGTTANETTRTVPVRAECDNAHGRLRASALGVGRIILREVTNVVLVPAGAVAAGPDGPVVFIRDADYLKPDGPKEFHTRPVRPGTPDGRGNVEILDGLRPGEVVAAKGVGVLAGEMRKAARGDNR